MKIRYVAKEVELSMEEKEILYKAEMIIKQMDDSIEDDNANAKTIKLALDRLSQLNLAYNVSLYADYARQENNRPMELIKIYHNLKTSKSNG